MAGPSRNWFDAGGDAYARYRPDYPDTLAAWLAEAAPARRMALDVGCGNGQFTRQLAAVFDKVVGLDPSADQIAHARPHPRIRYATAPAEALDAADHSIDLITAAQAAHWFDLSRFYEEVRRVAVPGAVLALVSYGVARFDAPLDERFQSFYTDQIGPFWPAERRMVDEGYAGIPFPFRAIPGPTIDIVREWSAQDVLGYISTWSAARRAREAGQEALLDTFARDWLALWGDPQVRRTVAFPIAMRLGIVD